MNEKHEANRRKWDVDAEPWRELGAPKFFFAVSAGAMDSMVNHYTANRKRRNADAYSPGGAIERRPDRANAVYAQRCREAFKGVPVVAGGVEASGGASVTAPSAASSPMAGGAGVEAPAAVSGC